VSEFDEAMPLMMKQARRRGSCVRMMGVRVR
jgi:hypothetical protein